MGAFTRKMTYDEEEQRTPSTGTATTTTPRIVMIALAAVLLVMVVVAMTSFSDTTNTHNRQADTPTATNLAVSGSTSSRPASCSKCSPIIDPTGAGHNVKGVWVPKYINKPGVYVPNDDPAETNGYCVDCSYQSFHDQCKDAGGAIGPPPPPPKYASCIAHYINGQQDCKVCGEKGKVCVNEKCIDCFAKENAGLCSDNGCGPYCGGGYTPQQGDPGYNPNPGFGHCRSCSQDGKKVCVGTGSDSVCLDCNHGTHVDKQRCQIGACLKPPPRGCAKSTEKCQPYGGGFKIIEGCAGSTCTEQGGSGYGEGYICL